MIYQIFPKKRKKKEKAKIKFMEKIMREIPAGWHTVTLKEVYDFKNGLNKEKEAFGKGTPIVNYMDVYKNYELTVSKLKGLVSLSTNEIHNFNVKRGDVFFTRTSETIEEIGFSAVMNDECENVVFSGFVLRARPKNNIITSNYAKYCFLSWPVREEIKRKSSYTTRALTSGKMLGDVEVVLPKTAEEQDRIVSILDCWAKAIALQENKIKKLEEKKKALMQKLLKPKEDWKSFKLGDACEIKTGKLDANQMENNGKYPFFTCSKEIYAINNYAFDCEALLMAGNGEIGDIKYYNGKFNAYQRTYVLSNFKFNIKYVMFYLLHNFDKSVCKGVQKSSMPYIKLELLSNAIIYYPQNYDKIVKLFDTIESKLQKQKDLLNNYKLQQKALMQKLLTGKVRVNG